MKSVIKILFQILIACTINNLNGQSNNFAWAKNMGGTSPNADTCVGFSVAIDVNGNLFTLGGYIGTIDFDPGLGITSLTSNNGYDIFLQKLDAAGNFVWVKSFGNSTGNNIGYSTTTDASGNVYCTGYFSGTVDFDPGLSTYNLTSNGANDIFLLKLDNNGNFQWANKFGGTGSDYGNEIKIDAQGNLIVAGRFSGTVNFGTGNLTSNGSTDAVVFKLSSSFTTSWAKKMGGTSADNATSTSTDNLGNVYTIGHFQGSNVDFNPGSGTDALTSHGGYDIFIQKLDPSGNFNWVYQIGAGGSDLGRSIISDNNGNVYITGSFQDTVNFNPVGQAFHNSLGDDDVYVVKLDSAGVFQWAKTYGSVGSDVGQSITINNKGNVYITGSFLDNVNFNTDIGGNLSYVSVGLSDIFIQRLDTGGNFITAKQMGGTGEDEGLYISSNSNGDIFTIGNFQGTADFNPASPSTFYLQSFGYQDVFVQKLDSSTVGINENNPSDNFIIYPNPSNGTFSIELQKTYSNINIKVSDVIGKIIHESKLKNTDRVSLYLSQPGGLYFIYIDVGDQHSINKLILNK